MARQPVEKLDLYIDVEDALARVCGNKAIYLRLLRMFEKSLQIDEFLARVDAGEMDEAARHVHTMKGVTANMSLPMAYQKCIEVEGELKNGVADSGHISELREILATTVLCARYVAETIEDGQ